MPVALDGVTDDVFVDTVQKRTFQYFKECSREKTGLVQDRANNFKSPKEAHGESYQVASVAATGYYLSSYIVAGENGWVSLKEVRKRVFNTLNFFLNDMEQVNGFFYHFVDIETGKRAWSSELSSIDTALFLGGVLHAKEYFSDDAEIVSLATQLYERVDWKWMLNDTNFLCMGWKPDRKDGRFLRQYWDHYSESMMMYIMAIGSPTHPIPAESWHAMRRDIKRYGDNVCIAYSALFTHQYSHIWVDFRDKNDGVVDYFKNSVSATLANREYCIDNKDKYKTYEEHVWGLTACDGPDGYKAYGGKPGYENHDGTVAPTGAGGSIAFTPELSIKALRTMYDKYGDILWGRYGFADSFNVDRNWTATDCIAIDEGTIVLMIQNYKTQSVWNYFMKNEWIQKGMNRIGFQKGPKTLTMPKPPQLVAQKVKNTVEIDGKLNDWDLSKGFSIADMRIEYGEIRDDKDFSGKMYFAYDDKYLYLALKIKDDEVIGKKGGSFIYKDDCVEIYSNPDRKGLLWGDAKDVQLGIVPNTRTEDGDTKSWAWFQNEDVSKSGGVVATWDTNAYGYTLEAAIKYDVLQVKPSTDIAFSISLHDVDEKDRGEAKLTTYFEDVNGKDGKIQLGTLQFN